MAEFINPAYQAFARAVGAELVFGQLLIRTTPEGFTLCHDADRRTPASALKPVNSTELRTLAQTTAAGAFRPLKSAPGLRGGWQLHAANADALGRAADQLYPGAVADWFALQTGTAVVTSYRAHTERQTGMYRITTKLTDPQAARMVRACCDARFCLKRRCWTVGDLAPDAAEEKSLIPCLEPCALLLEFARTAARLEQEEAGAPPRTEADRISAREFIARHREVTSSDLREADFGAPENPRRLRLLELEFEAVEADLSNPPEE